jgi:hypothetical protein
MRLPILSPAPGTSAIDDLTARPADARRMALAFVALVAVALLPLLLMRYPDLEDYLHHLSRMAILSRDASGPLARFYTVDWRLLPNLAMDLIVPPLTGLLPVQDAGRLFIGLSVLLMTSGTIALHAALYRRLSWWPFVVFLVIWNRIFLYGVFNYLLTLGLALWALAAWVHWRERSAWLRVPVFAAIAFTLFIFHLYAFGIYALSVLGYEFARADWASRDRTRLIGSSLVAGSQFVLPAALFLLQSPTSGLGDAFLYPTDLVHHKLRGFHHLFLNYHVWFDRLTFVVVGGAFLLGLGTRRIRIHPHLRWALVLLLVAYLLMPETFFGTGLADYRLPVGFTYVLIAGTEPRPGGLPHPKLLAAALLALFLVRIGLVAERWVGFEAIDRRFEEAIRPLPDGGTMVTIAIRMPDYHYEYHNPHLFYLSAIAIIEKSFFDPSFAIFADPGKQPVQLKPAYQHLVDELDARLGSLTDTRRWAHTPPMDLLLLPEGDAGRPLLQSFDYALVLYADEGANPAPAHLRLLFTDPHFQLYKVR